MCKQTWGCFVSCCHLTVSVQVFLPTLTSSMLKRWLGWVFASGVSFGVFIDTDRCRLLRSPLRPAETKARRILVMVMILSIASEDNALSVLAAAGECFVVRDFRLWNTSESRHPKFDRAVTQEDVRLHCHVCYRVLVAILCMRLSLSWLKGREENRIERFSSSYDSSSWSMWCVEPKNVRRVWPNEKFKML